MAVLLLCVFFYARERVDKKSVFLVILLNFFFPFTSTYNNIYYTEGFKGILFIVLVTASYYLFFKNIKETKFNFLHILLLAILSLIVRLRSIFLILVLVMITIISVNWIKRKKIRNFLFSISFTGISTLILFISFPISVYDYFLVDKYSIVDFKSIILNLFLFPRENFLLLILAIWLLFVSIIYMQGEKNKLIRKTFLFILVPEIVICSIYLLLFSNNNIAGSVLYLGLFPFIPLNIFYFFSYINKFSKRNRNIVLILFIIISIIELILENSYRVILE